MPVSEFPYASDMSGRTYFFFTTFFTVVVGATLFNVVGGAAIFTVVVGATVVVVVVVVTAAVVVGVTNVDAVGAEHNTFFTALGCFKRRSMIPSLVAGFDAEEPLNCVS